MAATSASLTLEDEEEDASAISRPPAPDVWSPGTAGARELLVSLRLGLPASKQTLTFQAVELNQETATLSACNVSDNEALSGCGGGIFSWNSALQLRGTTIAYNRALAHSNPYSGLGGGRRARHRSPP